MKHIIYCTKEQPVYQKFLEKIQGMDEEIKVVHTNRIQKVINVMKGFKAKIILVDAESFPDLLNGAGILRETFPDVFIIISHPSISRDEKQKYIELGFNHAASKPVGYADYTFIKNKLHSIVEKELAELESQENLNKEAQPTDNPIMEKTEQSGEPIEIATPIISPSKATASTESPVEVTKSTESPVNHMSTQILVDEPQTEPQAIHQEIQVMKPSTEKEFLSTNIFEDIEYLEDDFDVEVNEKDKINLSNQNLQVKDLNNEIIEDIISDINEQKSPKTEQVNDFIRNDLVSNDLKANPVTESIPQIDSSIQKTFEAIKEDPVIKNTLASLNNGFGFGNAKRVHTKEEAISSLKTSLKDIFEEHEKEKNKPSFIELKNDSLQSLTAQLEDISLSLGDIGLDNIAKPTSVTDKSISDKERFVQIVKERNKRADKNMTKDELGQTLNILINEMADLQPSIFANSKQRFYFPKWRKDRVLTIYRIQKLKVKGFSSDKITEALEKIHAEEKRRYDMMQAASEKAIKELDLSVSRQTFQQTQMTEAVSQPFRQSVQEPIRIDTVTEPIKESVVRPQTDLISKEDPITKPEVSSNDEESVLKLAEAESLSILSNITAATNKYQSLNEKVLKQDGQIRYETNQDKELTDEVIEEPDTREMAEKLNAHINSSIGKFNQLNDEIKAGDREIRFEIKEEDAFDEEPIEEVEDISDQLDLLSSSTQKFSKLNQSILKKETTEKEVSETFEPIFEDKEVDEYSDMVRHIDQTIAEKSNLVNQIESDKFYQKNNSDSFKNYLDDDDEEVEDEKSSNETISERNYPNPRNSLNSSDESTNFGFSSSFRQFQQDSQTNKSNESFNREYNSSIEAIFGETRPKTDSALITALNDKARQKMAEKELENFSKKSARDDISIEPPRSILNTQNNNDSINETPVKKKKKGLFGFKK